MNIDNFMKHDSSTSNIARGLISGFLGGLAGTLVKTAAEQFLDVREIDEDEEHLTLIDDLSERITGTPIGQENDSIADQFKEIPLGASLGAAYGYGKKDDVEINLIDGIVLGATTWASTHETSIPLSGNESNVNKDIPISLQLQELAAHLLYGVTTEVVRGLVSQQIKHLKHGAYEAVSSTEESENDDSDETRSATGKRIPRTSKS